MKINNINYKEWLRAAGIRSLRTVAQTALAMLTVEGVRSITDVDWLGVLSVSALAGIVSLLTSVVTGLPEITK